MHCRAQLLIPAAILIIDKIVGFARDQVALFNQSQAIGTGFGIAIFNLLDKAGDSNLKKFVEIAGSYGKKLQALEQRVVFILGLLQHTTIEGQPRCFAIKVVSRIVERGASHKPRTELSDAGAEWLVTGLFFGRRVLLGSFPGRHWHVFYDDQIRLCLSGALHEQMTLISLKLNFGTGVPVIRQSVGGMTGSILRHINYVFYLNSEFVIRLVPGDRGIHKVVEGSSSRFLLYVQNFASLILLLDGEKGRQSQ